jgi:tRNA wybutosine-synthesizing protein 2
MKFKHKIRELLENDMTKEELLLLPGGFQTLGNVIIIKLNPNLLDKKELISKTCLDMFPKIRSVYLNLGKIEGKFRTPKSIEYVAGDNNPIVEHKEHDIIYRFDIERIMFSQGNLYERRFLATLVKPNELIVDMFAGIGYFSLPIARHSQAKTIYSIELNPESYKYLAENIKLNHLEEIIVPISGDSNIEVKRLSKSGLKADRVIMGVFPAPKDFIKNALSLTKDEGTFFHYEGVAEKENFMNLFNEFKEIAEKERYECSLVSKRFVKSYGPNLFHIVLDIFVSKK